MEASLQAHQIKDFRKILMCMAKFGDDLRMHATPGGLQLSTINSTKSAFCLFKLDKDAFHSYKLTSKSGEGYRGVKCKLYVKAVLSVLGRGGVPQNVDRLELQIVDPQGGLQGMAARRDRRRADGTGAAQSSSREARLIVKLVCKHGILKTHSLNLADDSFLVAVVDDDTLTSRFTVPARTLRDWVDHFNLSAGGGGTQKLGDGTSIKYESELSWLFGVERVKIKTWEGGASSVLRRSISTEISLSIREFEEYLLGDDAPVQMTFPMKEFKAATMLAEQMSVPLSVAFSESGQPIKVQIETHGMTAEIAVATTDCQAFDAEMAQQQQQTSRAESVKAERAASTAAAAAQSSSSGAKRPAPAAALLGPSKKRSSLGLSQQRDSDPFRPAAHHHQTSTAAETHVEETQGVAQTQADDHQAEQEEEVLEVAGLGGMSQKELADVFDDDGFDDDDEEVQRPMPLFMEPSQVSAAGEEDDEMIGGSDSDGDGMMIPASAQVSEERRNQSRLGLMARAATGYDAGSAGHVIQKTIDYDTELSI